jgi:hypothetical protein
MRSKRLVWVSAVCWALLAFSLWSSPAQAVLPPGCTPVPGTVMLNPAHLEVVGSQFTQQCVGLPRPVQWGELAWHFVLPQAVLRPLANEHLRHADCDVPERGHDHPQRSH